MIENKFTQIAIYQYSSEAMIYKGKLESEGIEVFLKDVFTVDSNPLYSNAVGGIKMLVKTEDVKRANEILGTISKFSKDDNGNLLKCPKCEAENVEIYTSKTRIKYFMKFIIFYMSFLAAAFKALNFASLKSFFQEHLL